MLLICKERSSEERGYEILLGTIWKQLRKQGGQDDL